MVTSRLCAAWQGRIPALELGLWKGSRDHDSARSVDQAILRPCITRSEAFERTFAAILAAALELADEPVLRVMDQGAADGVNSHTLIRALAVMRAGRPLGYSFVDMPTNAWAVAARNLKRHPALGGVAVVAPVWMRIVEEPRAPCDANGGEVDGLVLERLELFQLDNPYVHPDPAVVARRFVQSCLAWGRPLFLRACAREGEGRAAVLFDAFVEELEIRVAADPGRHRWDYIEALVVARKRQGSAT